MLGRLLGLVQQMGSSHRTVLPKPFSRKGREGAEGTMLSTPQHQLESGRDAPEPHVAAHWDLMEHVVQRLHEAGEDNPTWKCVVWHDWLFVIAQTPSMQEKFIWDKCGEVSAEEGAGWRAVGPLQGQAATVGICP